jgi:predicted Zn-dependent protease
MSSRNFWRRNSDGLIVLGSATLLAVLLCPTASRLAELPVAAGPGVRATWSDVAHSPLGVWIQQDDADDGARTDALRGVSSALDAWSRVTPIRFEITADSARADVRVLWRHQLSDPATGTRVNGLTRYTVSTASHITGADVFIALRRANGRALSTGAVEAIALHELGHVIGLGHSRDSSDVMFPTVQVRGLSRADIAATRPLYSPVAARRE